MEEDLRRNFPMVVEIGRMIRYFPSIDTIMDVSLYRLFYCKIEIEKGC